MSQVETQQCGLHLAAGNGEVPCPHEQCAFWEPGGAVVPGNCLVERLGLDLHQADLAVYLLEVRERVGQARELADAEAAHLEFARRLGRDV